MYPYMDHTLICHLKGCLEFMIGDLAVILGDILVQVGYGAKTNIASELPGQSELPNAQFVLRSWLVKGNETVTVCSKGLGPGILNMQGRPSVV